MSGEVAARRAALLEHVALHGPATVRDLWDALPSHVTEHWLCPIQPRSIVSEDASRCWEWADVERHTHAVVVRRVRACTEATLRNDLQVLRRAGKVRTVGISATAAQLWCAVPDGHDLALDPEVRDTEVATLEHLWSL